MKTDIQSLYQIYLKHPIISTDSRALQKDSIFFALKGENFDAHRFVHQALEDGCAYAVIDNPDFHENEKTLLVDDVLKALQELAKTHREQQNIPFIGITGTNGKTTTKELIHAVLSTKYKVHATKGNLNNHIGVPLTLLSMPKDTEIAIIEMGANHAGEIGELCQISMPTHGIITNIGKAHLEGFGDEATIIKTKADLYKSVASRNGTIFVNADNPLLMQISEGITRTTYGSTHGDVVGTPDKNNIFVDFTIENSTIHSQLAGLYNFENLLAAACIGRFFNVPLELVKKGIENYTPQNNRSQVIQSGSNTIVMDAYNANPSSMRAAIENFAEIRADNKWLILGDMLELGDYSDFEHKHVLEILQKYELKNVVLVGEHFQKIASENLHAFAKTEDAKSYIQSLNIKNAHILIKGSRGIKLETLLDIF